MVPVGFAVGSNHPTPQSETVGGQGRPTVNFRSVFERHAIDEAAGLLARHFGPLSARHVDIKPHRLARQLMRWLSAGQQRRSQRPLYHHPFAGCRQRRLQQ